MQEFSRRRPVACAAMIVAVDARHLHAQRGVARYTRQMCQAVAADPSVAEVRALVPGRRAPVPIPGVEFVQTRRSSRVVHGTAAVLRRPTLLQRLGGDVAWLPAPAPGAPGTPYVLTVHDLSWLSRPQDFTAYERLWHRLLRMGSLVTGAAAIVCDASAVAEEVEGRWHVRPQVIEPGVSFSPATPAERPRPYVLYVGALEPRKGLEILDEAWTAAGLDADLLLVGEGRITIGSGERLGAVDDQALQSLYAGALALVLPSHLEGFGFTPREAAAHGVPSIVSDLPTLQLPGTLRVPPGDAAALAAALTSLPSERERLVAELVPPRSWTAAGAELVAVLQEAAR